MKIKRPELSLEKIVGGILFSGGTILTVMSVGGAYQTYQNSYGADFYLQNIVNGLGVAAGLYIGKKGWDYLFKK